MSSYDQDGHKYRNLPDSYLKYRKQNITISNVISSSNGCTFQAAGFLRFHAACISSDDGFHATVNPPHTAFNYLISFLNSKSSRYAILAGTLFSRVRGMPHEPLWINNLQHIMINTYWILMIFLPFCWIFHAFFNEHHDFFKYWKSIKNCIIL